MDSDSEIRAVLAQFEERVRGELREQYEQHLTRLNGLLADLCAHLEDGQKLLALQSIAPESVPLEELSNEHLVMFFKSTEVQRRRALDLVRQIACELASREGTSVTQAAELLPFGVALPGHPQDRDQICPRCKGVSLS